jgi:hypothetical protein
VPGERQQEGVCTSAKRSRWLIDLIARPPRRDTITSAFTLQAAAQLHCRTSSAPLALPPPPNVPHMVCRLVVGACTDHPKSAIFTSPCKTKRDPGGGGHRGHQGSEACQRHACLAPATHPLRTGSKAPPYLEAKQEVLRLDVSVDNVLGVAVLQRTRKGADVLLGRVGKGMRASSQCVGGSGKGGTWARTRAPRCEQHGDVRMAGGGGARPSNPCSWGLTTRSQSQPPTHPCTTSPQHHVTTGSQFYSTHPGGPGLLELAQPVQLLEQLALGGKLQNQVHALFIVEVAVQPKNVLVAAGGDGGGGRGWKM